MLRNLYVKNLAVAAEASVELEAGLNVLSGETGAGKSILIDSLGLLAGARAAGDLIRSDAEELTVSGTFDELPDEARSLLAEAGLGPGDDELVVRRVVSRSGRNRVFIDDEPVTLRLLSAVAPHLLRIHTQREELGLVSPEVQRHWLDLSAGTEAEKLLATVAADHRRYRDLAERWLRLTGDERLRLERLDLLRFQAREIDAAALASGEEDELRAERERLRHAESIGQAIGGSLTRLIDEEGAALDRLARSERQLGEIETWEPMSVAWREELAGIRVRLEEVAGSLRGRLDAVEHDPTRLDAIEERLALIERLLRKYGASSAEVLARRQEIETELGELESDDARRDELEAEVEKALATYARSAQKLSRRRHGWGEDLAAAVMRELADLAMDKARFSTAIGRRKRSDSPLTVEGEAVDFGASGFDEVTFVLAANPGEEAGPVARVASGGELSRVYLALQIAARSAGAAATPTLVFDEVDSGVGGAEAAVLGDKLARLARHGQVLAVTHLAQVASYADRHFRIRKEVEAGRTHMKIQTLDDGQRVDEVARMLAGQEVTDLSRSHAEELIAVAGKT